MASLIYTAIVSLDGCVADGNGDFGWAEPDAEVFAFINGLERPIGTYLYGRRLYEVMAYWETVPLEGQPTHVADFAEIWRGADKVVYSRTLRAPDTARSRLEREFDPSAVAELKRTARRDLSVGGPGLAAAALRAGLVDECRLFVAPVVVGGGTRWLPDRLRLRLRLLEERRFGSGTVYLRYRPVRQ